MRDTDLAVRNEPCELCGRSDPWVRVYRDPFGEASGPGRWPNLRMHSDCFLTYIKQRKSTPQAVEPQGASVDVPPTNHGAPADHGRWHAPCGPRESHREAPRKA
jgi:hypothetical protein